MSAAWFCPACQKYHAPHVDTCPGAKIPLPLGYVVLPEVVRPLNDFCANCKDVCGNAACPKRTTLADAPTYTFGVIS